MAKTDVLLVGENWATSATHTKGFDRFNSVTFHLGGGAPRGGAKGQPVRANLCALAGGCDRLSVRSRMDARRRRPSDHGRISQLSGHRRKGALARDAGRGRAPRACLPYDDRLEIPEGFAPRIVGDPAHPVLAGMEGAWPFLLGANEVRAKEVLGVEVLARQPKEEGGHPLLVRSIFGSGRTFARTSDIGPHWLPASFVEWPGYQRLWINALSWATRLT